MPTWSGEQRRGRGLLVVADQGIGDQVFFARYLKNLDSSDGAVYVQCQPRLRDLLARSYPKHVFLRARQAPAKPVSFKVSLSALANIFRHQTYGESYLAFDTDRQKRLRTRYGRRSGDTIVGLSWRSIKPDGRRIEAPLEDWRSLLEMPGLVFVSLQYGSVDDEIAALRERHGIRIVVDDEIDAMRDMESFAAQVSACDRVVSIANATVPVSVAVGRPVDVLLSLGQRDWRYPVRDSETPWFPGARLWRQPVHGDWAAAVCSLVRGWELPS